MLMVGAVGQIYRHLKPRGWVELQEYNCNVYYNDEETAKKAVWCIAWIKDLDEASLKFGKRLDVADYQRGWVEEAGFVDVTDYIVKVLLLLLLPLPLPLLPPFSCVQTAML